jgi:hypothetical protein
MSIERKLFYDTVASREAAQVAPATEHADLRATVTMDVLLIYTA